MFRDVPFNVMGEGVGYKGSRGKFPPTLGPSTTFPISQLNPGISPSRQGNRPFSPLFLGFFSHTLCFFRLCNPSLSISNGTDWNNSPQVKRLCIYGQYLKGVSPLLSPPEQNWGLTAKYNHLIFRNCMYSSWSFLTNASGNSFIDTKQGMPCQLVKHQALSTFHTHPDSLMGLLTPGF